MPEQPRAGRVDHQVAAVEILHEHRVRRAFDDGAEQAVAFDEGVLSPLAFADVAHDGEQVFAVEPDVGQVDLDGERRAVLAAVLALDHARAGFPHVLHQLPPAPHRDQRIDVRDGQRAIFVARIAMFAASSFVDVEEAPRPRIDDFDGVVGVIEERAEPQMGPPLVVRAAVAREVVGLIAALGRLGRFGRHGLPRAGPRCGDALTDWRRG